MENNIIKRLWNQNRMVNIEDLSGMAFQAEAGGHTFKIAGTDDEGSAVSLSGTVSGVFMRPDGTDVALTGSISGGVASVTLTSACYAVLGRFGLTVFVTVGSETTAIYAAIGTVARSSTGTVAGDTPGDVVDLINAIAAAVATIPPSYTDLMANIAPIYSTSAVYAVGDYAWYDGSLYKCIVPITSGESWTAAHWASVVLTKGIKDDLNKKAPVIINTASGEVAHFTDGADGLPFKSILASILPIQDLHGYSKPWAAGAGKNKCSYDTAYEAPTGNTATVNLFNMNLTAGVTYTFSCKQSASVATSTRNTLCIKPSGGSAIYENSGTNYNPSNLRHVLTYTAPSTGEYTFQYWGHTLSADVTLTEWQVEESASFTSYAPYSNICPITGRTGIEVYVSPTTNLADATTYQTDWTSTAGTVYAGTVDPVTGVLTATHELVTLDGVTTGKKFTSKGSAAQRNEFACGVDGYILGLTSARYLTVQELEDLGVINSFGDSYAGGSYAGYGFTVYALPSSPATQFNARFSWSLDSGVNTVALANSEAATLYAAGTPIQYVYPLATPVEYQLTTEEIDTLFGGNSVWSDSGSVSVEYPADTKLYIDQKIMALAAQILNG